MRARVTAVLVASNGADYLPRTLEALHAQTRQPDSLIVVDVGSTDSTPALLAGALPTHFIQASGKLAFGTAVTHALGVVAPPAHENEWLWLLAHDTAPEPGALAALLAAVEVSPSVAAAGPKQMDWEHPDYISEFGETMTRLGSSFPLAETELDQAQHDRMSDVLGMGAAGLLVRHRVWNDLGGFDPALPTADNGLDFSVRVRLAGHRVIGVPASRIASAGVGLASPSRSPKGRARRKRQADRRAAQLHRRLVYAPGFAAVFHWLSLVPLAIVRSLIQLLRKQPGAIGGELSAAFRTAFGSHVAEARKRLHSSKSVSWHAVAPLRIPGDEVRRRRSLQREIALTHLRGEKDRIQFVSSGGATTVLAFVVLGLVMFIPFISAPALTGGSLLPLSASISEVWSHIGYGWRDIGLGFVGAADPFATVLAVLGSITFWAPSFSIVGLYLAAMPLAALAAWFLGARLTDKPWLRATAAVLWALAPTFLAALDGGVIGAVIAHLLLPWLVLAGLAARKSWSASAMAAILFAATVAAAPSLWPALLIVWLVAVATSGRNVARYLALPLPGVIFFAPLAWDQFRAGNPLGLLADPGVPAVRQPGSLIELLSGIPDSAQSGWTSIASGLGIDSSVVQIVLAVAAVPLVLLAILALVLPGRSATRGIIAVVGALLGLVTAIASTRISLDAVGPDPVSIWAGSGLSLYWLGLICAAVIGLHALKRMAFAPAMVAAVAIVLVAVPLVASPLLVRSAVTVTTGDILPAYVTAQAAANPRVGTLVLKPQPNGGMTAEVVNGTGVMLDDQSTLAATRRDRASEAELSNLVGNLASLSGTDSAPRLSGLGVSFVLLADENNESTAADQKTTTLRAAAALEGNSSLTTVGKTPVGTLWQIASGDDSGDELTSLPEPQPSNVGTAQGVLILVVQGITFLLMVLLALPAGRLQPHGVRAVSALEPPTEVEAAGDGPDPDDNRPDAEDPEGNGDPEPSDPQQPAPDASVRPLSKLRQRFSRRKTRGGAATPEVTPAIAEPAVPVAEQPGQASESESHPAEARSPEGSATEADPQPEGSRPEPGPGAGLSAGPEPVGEPRPAAAPAPESAGEPEPDSQSNDDLPDTVPPSHPALRADQPFSRPPVPGDDDEYDPDAETVRRVKPITVTEEDENHGN